MPRNQRAQVQTEDHKKKILFSFGPSCELPLMQVLLPLRISVVIIIELKFAGGHLESHL